MGKYEDDDLMEEMMLDKWDGLKEEPDSRKKGYPAKKKKKTEKQSEGKFYQLVGLIHGEVMHMPEKNTDPAVSEDQAMYFICFDLKKRNKNNRPTIRSGFKKIWNSWRKYMDKNGPKEYWVEEITVDKKEEKSMDTVLTKEQWELLSYMKDSCYGNHDYPGKSGMVTYIKNGKAELRFEQFKSGNFLTIIDREDKIHGSYELNDVAASLLFENVFSQVGGIWFRRDMPEYFRNYIIMAKTCLIFSGIVDPNMFFDNNEKEEIEMEENKKMNLDDVVEMANAQAEAIENNNAVEEAQQEYVEETEKNVEEVVNMANNENKKVETAKEIEQQVVNETVARKLANELTLHKADDSEITVKVNIIKNTDKDGKVVNSRGKIMAFSEKLKKQVEIGSFVIGGGYSLPIFMIKSKGLKDETFKPVRDCDKENRTVRFHGSKNYFVLLSLLMNKEEIEAAKAAEISRRFPAICQRSESKGFPKNIFVTVALSDGNELKLDGWKQREHRPLFMENEDQSVTVRWDFGKGYKSPSIKYFGKMLRENHDGVSGSPEDVKIFNAIKSAIENALKG